MNPANLSDEELTTAFAAAKKAILTGARVTSWSSGGTSVTRTTASGSAAAENARADYLAREIRYRIFEGRISQKSFPHLMPIPRPIQGHMRSGAF